MASGRDVTLNTTGALDLGASTVSGNLTVTSAGAISDSGALSVAGTTSLIAGATNNVILDSPGNDFVGSISATGADINLRDANTLSLSTMSVAGELVLDCGAAVGDAIMFPAASAMQARAVRLNTRNSVASAGQATIIAQGDLELRTDLVEMGQNHKLTILGNLAISGLTAARCTSVTLGDVNALGTLRIDAGTIQLLGRSPTLNLNAQGGWTPDPSVDFVAGGSFQFSVMPTMGGAQPLNRAVFSSPLVNPDALGTLGAYSKTLFPSSLTRALLIGPAGQVLDLAAAVPAPMPRRSANPATFVPVPMPMMPALISLPGLDDSIELEGNRDGEGTSSVDRNAVGPE